MTHKWIVRFRGEEAGGKTLDVAGYPRMQEYASARQWCSIDGPEDGADGSSVHDLRIARRKNSTAALTTCLTDHAGSSKV